MNAIPSKPSPLPVRPVTHDHVESASVPGLSADVRAIVAGDLPGEDDLFGAGS